MKSHQLVLQRVGTTLILLGVIAIHLTIWKFVCTTPSSLDEYYLLLLPLVLIAFIWGALCFIVPGILLFRGGLRTAKYIRYLALFGLASDATYVLLSPILQPLDYQLALLHVMPATLALETWQAFVYIALGFWLQYMLGRPEIMDAQVNTRVTPASIAPPLWIGVICALCAMGMMYWGLHGDDANKAVRMVKAKLGNNNQYFASNIHWDLADQIKVRVVVVEYNSQEIKQVTVRWKEADSEVAQ
jgi:hypothetical protein